MSETTKAQQDYQKRMAKERGRFESVTQVHDLPPIFHYWSNKYIRPMVEEFGFSQAGEFFAKFLAAAAERVGGSPVFLSLGAGNCDTEVQTAQLLRKAGLTDFVIECLELNPEMLKRGKELATSSGLGTNLAFIEGDFNRWKADKQYTAIFANQALHHVLELEHLFAEVKRGLHSDGFFVASDIIGRNGHLRWPEALHDLKPFWRELPIEYRWNRSLKRNEDDYINHDCSSEGFEGIRAQDILPLLLRNFDFHLFLAFGNIIDIFVDRAFGPNFHADEEWDRAFVDRVHSADEQGILDGTLTPTHMFAVMTTGPCAEHYYSRGLAPERCVRREQQIVQTNRLEIVTPVLRPLQQGGEAFSMTMAAYGGTPPYVWSSANLPPGLTLSFEGLLSGVPESYGEFAPLITVKDGSDPPSAVAQRYTLVNRPREQVLPLTLIQAAQPCHAIVGSKYVQAILAAGGAPPLTWSLAKGTLPRGLSLDAARGVISGEPVGTSNSAVLIRVSDVAGQSAMTGLDVKIDSPDTGFSRVGVFPHLPSGGSWNSRLCFVNPSSIQLSFAVLCRSSGGSPVNWSLNPAPPPCQCHGSGHYSLDPHASLVIAVNPGQKAEVNGWVEVFATGPVLGHALFIRETSSGTRSEVTTPIETGAKSELLVPFDNGDGNRTGTALLNLSTAGPDNLVAAIWDESGEFIGAPNIPLAGGRHTAFMLPERFPFTAHRRGVLNIHATSRGPIYVVSLRVSPEGMFTLLPQIQTSPVSN